MDRNTVIGMGLILALFLTWSLFFREQPQPTPDPQAAAQAHQDSIKAAAAHHDSLAADLGAHPGISDSAYNALPDSARLAILRSNLFKKYGDFAPLYEGTETRLHVVTDKMDFYISSKGAQIKPLTLNEYKEYSKEGNGKPLPIVADSLQYQFSARFAYNKNFTGYLDTRDLYFTGSASQPEMKVSGKDSVIIRYKAEVSPGKYLEWVYTVHGDRYDMGVALNVQGLGTELNRDGKFDIVWNQDMPMTEKHAYLSRQKATLQYYLSSGSLAELSPVNNEPQEEKVAEKMNWISFRNQFFAQTLLAPAGKPFGYARLKQTTPGFDLPHPEVLRKMEAEVEVDMQGNASESFAFTLLNAPVDYNLLTEYGNDLYKQVHMGSWGMQYINLYLVMPIFRLLEHTGLSYGLIILLLAILIKVILLPFQVRTHKSMTKMRLVTNLPEVKKIDEKHKNDPTKASQEKMPYFRKYGVSMMGGCLPILFSYPFLLAMLTFIPNLFEMRQDKFLWAEDLSTFDSVLDFGFEIPMYGDHVSLFCLLMTLSLFAFTIVNQRMQSTPQNNPVLKYLPYIMPILFLGFLNKNSAGLSWYYLCSNVLAIAQTQLLKVVIPDSKLMGELEAYAKANKDNPTKSRMERWMESQQKKQQEMQKNRGKK